MVALVLAGSLAARLVWLGGERWLAPGELVWDASGRLVRVGPPRDRRRVRDVAVVPGLVDAHVHLQLPALARRETAFLPWVREVLAARGAMRPAAVRAQAVASLRELRAGGTTAVGEIDSLGLSLAALQRVPLAGRCYQEVTGFHLDAAGARALVRARARVGTDACPGALSPHAPYSVSSALFAAAAARSRHLAIHTAEVPEEQQLLRRGTGPFADLLRELGRLPAGYRPPGVGAVRWLERLGLLRPTTQLVHCQELERGDAARIAEGGAAVVVCPGTIEYFGRTPPPLAAWLRAGIPVALGTDSRASNRSLSMLDELVRAHRLWPEVAPTTLLAMATEHGGRALGRAGLGRLRRGGRADFCCIASAATEPAGLAEHLVTGRAAVVGTCVQGRWTHARRGPAARAGSLPGSYEAV